VKSIAIFTRRPDASGDVLSKLAKAEADAVWRGFATGHVRSAHMLEGGRGAILELETTSVEEATEFVERLPYVEHGLLNVVHHFVKPFAGFASLVKPPDTTTVERS